MNNKHWLFRYRIEFPIIICVLTTLIYSSDTDIFLFYRPNLTLLFSILAVFVGVAIHTIFGRISPMDDFQFNKYPITNHTKQIGDYFIWLGCALFSGSMLVIAAYTLIYILFYGFLSKNHSPKESKLITIKTIVIRDVCNFILFMGGLMYISALKNYLITESFSPANWVKLLFVVSVGAFITILCIFNIDEKKKVKL